MAIKEGHSEHAYVALLLQKITVFKSFRVLQPAQLFVLSLNPYLGLAIEKYKL